jgi:hypothetical protein
MGIVCGKSFPLNRTGSSSAVDETYEKQSPKLRLAGWRPLPYLRNARRARSACFHLQG